MNKEEILDQLQKLEFFKYVDIDNIETVKQGLIENIAEKNAFFFPSEVRKTNIDGRLFSFDFEALTEGGALHLFEQLRPSFEKAGFRIESLSQVFDSNVQSSIPIYSFTLNGKTCNLSNVPKIPFLLQGFVAKRYLRFINNELHRQKIKERVYIMNDKTSDSDLAFLTRKQVSFIRSLQIDSRDKPYKFTTAKIFKGAFEIVRIIFKAIFSKKINTE